MWALGVTGTYLGVSRLLGGWLAVRCLTHVPNHPVALSGDYFGILMEVGSSREDPLLSRLELTYAGRTHLPGLSTGPCHVLPFQRDQQPNVRRLISLLPLDCPVQGVSMRYPPLHPRVL